MYTYMHACIHTYIHAHSLTSTYIFICIHTQLHVCTNACIYMCVSRQEPHTHIHIHTNMYFRKTILIKDNAKSIHHRQCGEADASKKKKKTTMLTPCLWQYIHTFAQRHKRTSRNLHTTKNVYTSKQKKAMMLM